MKKVDVTLSSEAKTIYLWLKKRAESSKIERSILNAIDYKIGFIRADPHYGNPVAKRLIPKEYLLKYDIDNLFRIELPNFWRMLYSVSDNEVEIIAFIIEVIDHKDYNKKFGYKNR